MKDKIIDCLLVLLLFIFLNIPTIVFYLETHQKPESAEPVDVVYISGQDLYEDHTNWIMSLGIEATSDEPDIEENDIPEVTASNEPEKEFVKINSTAYYNKYNAHCADGTWPTPGVLAGKREWIGKTVELYDSDKNCMGDYTFHDVGYGKSLGYGHSVLHKGEALGDIEAGVTIDIFMNTLAECQSYGRKEIYLVWK